jgi:hypothetical protein
MGVLLELEIADTLSEAERMVKKIRPEIEIHQEFIRDLTSLYPS